MKSGVADCNGQKLYWESHGEGVPLVLVMGIGYDSTLWGVHQVPFFSKHFRTIVFDNRDVGQSSKATSAYTIADMADDLTGLLDALQINRAHILGLSMGGMICQEFAIRHPDRLLKMVLTGTGASTAIAKFDPISIWSFVKAHDTEGLTFAAQQFIWLFSDSFLKNHEAVDQTLQMLASNPNPVSPEAYQRQADAYVKHNTLSRLDNVKAPTLVVSGERDRLTPPWICKEVADGIIGAKYVFIEGERASHVMPIEYPEGFNSVVLSFLQ